MKNAIHYDQAPGGSAAWRKLLCDILDNGHPVAPRGQPTLEVLHVNKVTVDMARAVVTDPRRKLSYQFQCAEALWILAGDNRLEPLTKYVKRMADFSDDGVTLAGAYGPRVVSQLDYVVNALRTDRDTRQAVLSIWTPCPAPSKDIPCTISMVFSIRDNRLYQHVMMRSSDAWMGIPYDMFSFSCIGLRVLCAYNAPLLSTASCIVPGALTISMTSSHLYERDLENVNAVLESIPGVPIEPPPKDVLAQGKWSWLEKI